MEKYIGNKKSIVDGISAFLNAKGINKGVFIDVFSGTTNVGQYFKQRGYSVICNDINEFSFVLGKAYIENNTFPLYENVIRTIENEGFVFDEEQIKEAADYSCKRICSDKTYPENYFNNLDYGNGIRPLLKVIQYLNNFILVNLSDEEELFLNYYTEEGGLSEYISSRGTTGKRNYFTADNARRLGAIMSRIKSWKEKKLVNDMEFYILLTAVIEEVTLNANVNGTFHDFNRKKLYPNALQKFELKAPVLNIYTNKKLEYKVFAEDSNELHENPDFMRRINDESVLYIDPPYNFRQYSAYYHLLNFIAKYHDIEDVLEYAEGFKFVRGQNMADNFNSDYCYRDKFIDAMEQLVLGIPSRNVAISYYDENNHWNHGRDSVSMEGREAMLGIFEKHQDLFDYDRSPHIIPRTNYQSQSGAHKKQIDELVFFARRKINVD